MKIELASGLKFSVQDIQRSEVFRDWVPQATRKIHSVLVTDVDFWGGEIHALHLVAQGTAWPVRFILRSPTVDVLTMVSDGRKSYVVFVEQYREAVGRKVLSNVAGGMKRREMPEAAATREAREELGLDPSVEFSLKRLLHRPALATPGVTNESVYFLRADIQVSGSFLASLHNKRTGVVEEGENIRLHVVEASQARKFISSQDLPDAKTLLSLMYAGL